MTAPTAGDARIVLLRPDRLAADLGILRASSAASGSRSSGRRGRPGAGGRRPGPRLSSFTSKAVSRMSGANRIRMAPLTTTSNSLFAAAESRRPDEKPSEKISQEGLRLSRSTRPVSRSRKEEISLTKTPVVLIRSRSASGSALRLSSSASTTSLAPRRTTWSVRLAMSARLTAPATATGAVVHRDIADRRRSRRPGASPAPRSAPRAGRRRAPSPAA